MKRYNITVNGTAYDVTVEETDGNAAPVAAPAAAPAPKKAAAPAAPAVPAAPAADVIPNRQALIAAISAAIAEDMGTDLAGIRILSVKKI